MIGDNVRFNRHTTVKSGGTVKIVNKGAPEAGPHTISLLKKSALPRTLEQAEPCFEGQGVCAPLVRRPRGRPEDPEEPPGVLVYNAGAAGFDTHGRRQDRRRLALHRARPGRLDQGHGRRRARSCRYFCAVHPWMQGKITVK